jgi:hypothetical protein
MLKDQSEKIAIALIQSFINYNEIVINDIEYSDILINEFSKKEEKELTDFLIKNESEFNKFLNQKIETLINEFSKEIKNKF